MHKSISLAIREYKAAVKTKGFVIGLLLAPLLMSGSGIAYFLLKDRVDIRDKHVIILDHTGVVADSVIRASDIRSNNEIIEGISGKKIKPAYYIKQLKPEKINTAAQRLALSDRIRAGDLHAFLEIGAHAVHPAQEDSAARIYYYAMNSAMDDVRSWLARPINNRLRQLRLLEAGVDADKVRELFHWTDIDAMGLVTVNEKTGGVEAAEASKVEAILVPIIIMMLMFLMIMMSVPGMLNSVMEEKTQRIAEVLLGSIKPFEFMMGKVLGGIGVSLTTSAVYILGGAAFLSYMGFQRFIPYSVLPWFFVFMLLAVIMYGAMSAAFGSTCSEPKDAQSMTFPVLIPALFPMFIYFIVVKEPLSDFSTWMSLIPPFSPMLMTLRMSTPEQIPFWQPWAALIGVFVFTLLFVWIAGRIFRVAILMQGTPPKLTRIVRWAIKG